MGDFQISVVIPTYNRASLVGRAVETALAATLPGDEVIVVDDGSTDDTADRLEVYAERIRYIRSPQNVGPGSIRNLGVREARRPLIAFLDSDDEWMPDKLQLQRVVMDRRPDVLFCFTDFAHRTRTGEEIRNYFFHWHRDRRSWDEILGPGFAFSSLAPLPPGRPDFRVHVGDMYATQMLGDYICTSTLIVWRERAGDALHFPDLRRYQDWECFGRLARAGPAAYMDCETQWNCDHVGPRQTQANELYYETAKVEILRRLWGSDPGFLAQHRARFEKELARHELARGKALLSLGRNREAREQFRVAGTASVIDWALSSLPGPLTRAVVGLRRRLRTKERVRPPARPDPGQVHPQS